MTAAIKDGKNQDGTLKYKIVGVAIVGHPVSRYLDDGWALEVNRLCTDGTRNACSFLYAAAWRAARNIGSIIRWKNLYFPILITLH